MAVLNERPAAAARARTKPLCVSPRPLFLFFLFVLIYDESFSRSIAHVLLLILLYTRIEPRTKWLLLLGAVIISSLCVAAKTDG